MQHTITNKGTPGFSVMRPTCKCAHADSCGCAHVHSYGPRACVESVLVWSAVHAQDTNCPLGQMQVRAALTALEFTMSVICMSKLASSVSAVVA